jgi:uncharacterized repeat protein (TIGR01451 family)
VGSGGSDVGRYRLYAALLLLGLGLIGWCGGMAAQGMGNGSPYPPPSSDTTERPVIASGQPLNNTARAVVRFADTNTPESSIPRVLSADLDPTIPAIPRPPGVRPVVPIPDDGLFSRYKLRHLPPPVQTLSTEPQTPPEITVPPVQEPIVIRPAPAIQPVKYESSDPTTVWPGLNPQSPGSPRQGFADPVPVNPNNTRGSDATKRLVNTNPVPVVERTDSPSDPLPSGAQTSILNLEVVGPATINRGQPFVYELVLRNNGSTPVYQVQVEETLQSGVRCLGAAPQPVIQGGRLSWNLGTLLAGAEQRLRLEIQPPADGEVVSSAHATFTTSSALRTRITKPELSLTQSAPENVQVGDDVVVRLDVRNTGTGPAAHVVVRDQLPAGLRHSSGTQIESAVGTLAAGETRTLTLRAQAVQSGKQINEAAATGDDCATTSAQAIVMVTQATLVLRETSPRQGLVDQVMDYRLEVASTGSATATNVRVSDVLPAGLEFVSASERGAFSAATKTVSWNVGSMAPGQTCAVTFRAQARTAGEYVHQAVAAADRGVEAKAAGAVRSDGVAALTLAVTATENLLELNAETIYEIRVVNQGSGSSSNVRIVAAAPEGLSLMSAEGPAVSHVQGQLVLFDPVPQLLARGELTYRVVAKGRRPGDWRFKAQLTSDQLQRPVIKEETTRVYSD